jgi:hypothetical protein
MIRTILILLILVSWIPFSFGQEGEKDQNDQQTRGVGLPKLGVGKKNKAEDLIDQDSLEQVRLDSLAAMFVHDDFADNRNNWRVVMSSKLTATMVDGTYQIRQKDPKNSQFLLQYIPPTDLQDFYVELDITHQGGGKNLGYGLVWGVTEDERSFYALLISANQKYTIMRVEKGRFQDIKQWNESKLVEGSGKPNRLGLLRRGRDHGVLPQRSHGLQKPL